MTDPRRPPHTEPDSNGRGCFLISIVSAIASFFIGLALFLGVLS